MTELHCKKFLVCNISFFIFSCVSVIKNTYIKCNNLISICCSLHTTCRDPEFLQNVGKCVCVFLLSYTFNKVVVIVAIVVVV